MADGETWASAAVGGGFPGRTAVVTGAARGIGRGVATLLAALGVRVVAVDRDAAGLADAFGDGSCVPWTADLAVEDTEALAAAIWERHGPVQLLVNNAGIQVESTFLEAAPEDVDAVLATNLRGPWFLTRGVARRLVAEGLPGAVVFVSSLHDTFVRTLPHYSASKAAVSMLVKELAYELAPHRIRVNAVSPGSIRTAVVAPSSPEQEAAIARLIPLGRIGEPADVARLVAILLDDAWSGYVTGANVRVDGGLALRSWSVEQRQEVSCKQESPDGARQARPRGRLLRRPR